MSFKEESGNLFETVGLDALAQGVNCCGVMGAGIAAKFKSYWPEMFDDYRRACRTGELQPGGLHTWQGREDGHRIYNLATQPRPGRCAHVRFVELALMKMAAHAIENNVRSIGLPRLGCGIGGLNWRDVRPIVERCAQGVDIVAINL